MGGEGPPPFPRREKSCLRVGSVYVNGLNALGKTRELVETFWERKVGCYGNTRNPNKSM